MELTEFTMACRRTLKSALALAVAFFLSSCGYAFQGGGSVLPPDVKKIAVPLVENNSTESGLGIAMTEALKDRFERFGVLTVVDDINEADAVLKATIADVKKSTSSVTSRTDTALQFNTTVTLSGELRRVSGQVLWRNTGVTATKPFGATSGVVVTSSSDFAGSSLGSGDLGSLSDLEVSRGQERETLLQLVDDVAKKVYDEAVSPDF